jgi:hypothetical protein
LAAAATARIPNIVTMQATRLYLMADFRLSIVIECGHAQLSRAPFNILQTETANQRLKTSPPARIAASIQSIKSLSTASPNC